MNIHEFKTRLEKAISEAGGLPGNFWWAMLQVVIELYSRQKIKPLEELKTCFKDYHVPMAVRKMLYNNWYSPACAEDLKIRAQIEAVDVDETKINALHFELHRLCGLTCQYRVWKEKTDLAGRYFVGMTTDGLNNFIDALLDVKSTSANDNDDNGYLELIETVVKPFSDEVKGGFEYLARVYAALYECNSKGFKLPSHIVDELSQYKDTFLWESVSKNQYSEDIVEQCEEALGKLHANVLNKDLAQVLRDRWMRIAKFLPVKEGQIYYFPDISSEDGYYEVKWYGTSSDKRLLSRGWCFHSKEDVIAYAERMA
jgi:hypothetical protein|nr:MAG TPA: hypothetical protein [Ackermannviridae sp.]